MTNRDKTKTEPKKDTVSITLQMPRHLHNAIRNEAKAISKEDNLNIGVTEFIRLALVQYIQIRKKHIKDPRLDF